MTARRRRGSTTSGRGSRTRTTSSGKSKGSARRSKTSDAAKRSRSSGSGKGSGARSGPKPESARAPAAASGKTSRTRPSAKGGTSRARSAGSGRGSKAASGGSDRPSRGRAQATGRGARARSGAAASGRTAAGSGHAAKTPRSIVATLPVEVGRVVHVYPRAGAAVVALTGELRAGDAVAVRGATTDFCALAERLERDGRAVDVAAPGEEIGVALPERAREGDRVYRLSR